MSSDPLLVFASTLRRLRADAGISQEQLGLRSGIDLSNISRYEAGKREPGVRTIVRLAQALDVPPGELFRDIE